MFIGVPSGRILYGAATRLIVEIAIMAQLLKLKQVRSGHQTHVKKLIVKTQTEGEELPLDEMLSLLNSLRSKQVILEKIDSDILGQLQEDAEIAREIEVASEFSDTLIASLSKLELSVEYIKNKVHESKSTSDRSADVKPPANILGLSSQGTSNVKLQPLNIQKYDGSLLDWRRFWDQFEVTIDGRSDFPPATKLVYLKSYLQGDAERAIRGYATTAENYANAVNTLKKRFGNKQARIAAHMKELRELKAVNDVNDISGSSTGCNSMSRT